MAHLTTLATTIKSLGWKLLLPIFAFILPIKALLILVAIAILIDTVTGIWAAKKLKKEVSSHKFSAMFGKMFIYQSIVITLYALDIYLLGDIAGLFIGIPLIVTKCGAIILIGTEMFSVDENMRKVNGKGFWHYIKRVLDVAKKLKAEKEEIVDEK